ncbi:hypothetical protein LQ564_05335 [Massilia sp. G4R7]|uniref:DUF1453 domain-containing protein n=1 Tax=Massilia phyllostachyos TaxID=2898585 RepID=A0ABS8Q1X8_9BURK|nr:hypothetical protein [Massilia phyllostachyos]MCD2515734.1 hypothetical protein [Massilia phyllostachyos]
MTQSNIIMLAMAPLIMWRVYKRVQRLTVRQQSRMWRHWFGVIFLPLALLTMGAFLLTHPPALASLLFGTTTGGLLGWHALRRTGFERVGEDYFYTPYAPIGMVVAMIFIVRVLYRVYEMFTLGAGQVPSFGSSPLTMGIMGVVAGYYLVYASGLLRWRLAGARDGAK